jgi:protein-disulfide isomerase
MITRREFVMSSASVPALGALGAFEGPVWAQTFSVLELEGKGPLDDIPMGSATAPVTIIEYASMTCPHCAAFAVEVFPKLKEKYIDTGKVRYIMRLYPTQPVQLSAAAYMLARCAGPDKFYPLIEALFEQQQKWVIGGNARAPLFAIAKQAGFTEEAFDSCITDRALQSKVQQAWEQAGSKFKVESTPTFFINGQKFPGGMPIEEFDKIIQPYLKG